MLQFVSWRRMALYCCLLYKFIQEHGPRAQSRSTVRSQARKYAAIERRRRENPFPGPVKDRLRRIQMAPDPAFELLVTRIDPESNSMEAADPSSHFADTQHPHQNTTLNLSKDQIDVQHEQADTFSVCLPLARVGKYYEPLYQLQVSSQTIIGAGRVDPFQRYPVEAQPYMEHLIYYCKNSVSFFLVAR